jgi:hypothetical protein
MFSVKRALLVAMDAPTEREPATALIARLTEIQNLSTGQLRAEFQRLAGRPTGSWNREWLRRKVSWLVQERERQRSDAVKVPTLAREVRDVPRSPRLDAPIRVLAAPIRDPRIPRPGSVLVRHYKGLALTVRVEADGFTWNGASYKSLSAVAKAITGQHMSGPYFFRLRERKRGSK